MKLNSLDELSCGYRLENILSKIFYSSWMCVMISFLAPAFEQMQQQLRSDLTDNPPLPGSLSPRKGDLVAALFIDKLW